MYLTELIKLIKHKYLEPTVAQIIVVNALIKRLVLSGDGPTSMTIM
jgi:hypothetical protein